MTRPGTRLRLTLVVLFGILAAGPVPAGPGASVAVAQDEDPVAEARRLADEAREFFREAGDTDASHKDRREARQEAYRRLSAARALLDEILDAAPERTEELDELYSGIAMMMFWIKKEAAIGELDGLGTKDGPAAGTSSGGGADDGDEPSGIGGASRPDDPDDRPAPPEDGADGDGDGGTAASPAPEAPTEPEGPTPADDLAEIVRYEERHPGDVPGLHERYTRFLAKHADPSLPEYGEALDRREALDRKLKDVYRTLRDEDPAELAEKGDAGVERLVGQLVDDLDADRDATVRMRAVRYLGQLGSTQAVSPLLELLDDEPPGELADACAEALATIGGSVTCRRIVRHRGDELFASHAFDILAAIVQRGGPEGRVAGETLADYVIEREDGFRTGAAEELRAAGPAGALGLAKLLPHTEPALRGELIEHLGTQGEPRVAGYLALFLKAGVVGLEKEHSRAARKAIEALGKPCVRYLIPALDEDDVAVWTAEMLRRLTGAKPRNDKRRTWERWYRKNRHEFR